MLVFFVVIQFYNINGSNGSSSILISYAGINLISSLNLTKGTERSKCYFYRCKNRCIIFKTFKRLRMEFKIDTKATYTHITPIYGHLNAIMAAALQEKCTELSEAGSQNFLIDLNNCQDADKDVFALLGGLHEACYGNEQSLVFTNVPVPVMKVVKEMEADLVLNIAPKEIEAIDIISMEILERDLFNEEG